MTYIVWEFHIQKKCWWYSWFIVWILSREGCIGCWFNSWSLHYYFIILVRSGDSFPWKAGLDLLRFCSEIGQTWIWADLLDLIRKTRSAQNLIRQIGLEHAIWLVSILTRIWADLSRSPGLQQRPPILKATRWKKWKHWGLETRRLMSISQNIKCSLQRQNSKMTTQ